MIPNSAFFEFFPGSPLFSVISTGLYNLHSTGIGYLNCLPEKELCSVSVACREEKMGNCGAPFCLQLVLALSNIKGQIIFK